MKLDRCKPYLGTYVTIHLEADLDFDELAELSNKGFSAISEVHEMMSFHSSDSLLSQLNKAAHISPIKVTDELIEVLELSLEVSKQSEGAFDITIAPDMIKSGLLPSLVNCNPCVSATWQDIQIDKQMVSFNKPLCIDLGGLAKGYAVDKAFEVILHSHPTASIIINAGGDLRMTNWQNSTVHIAPHSAQSPLTEVTMQQAALATSSYAYIEDRPGHIIQPSTHQILNLSQSVSIFAPTCMLADALTKVVAIHPKTSILEQYEAYSYII